MNIKTFSLNGVNNTFKISIPGYNQACNCSLNQSAHYINYKFISKKFRFVLTSIPRPKINI